eukprot:jgi/Mesen1/4157/ME000219S03287
MVGAAWCSRCPIASVLFQKRGYIRTWITTAKHQTTFEDLHAHSNLTSTISLLPFALLTLSSAMAQALMLAQTANGFLAATKTLGSISLTRSVALPAVKNVQMKKAGSTQTVALFNKAKPASQPIKVKPQAKSIAETGIFGTSGGIGFTKQNELFVGRLAMLGFAASILGEALTGKGPLAQFDIETGLPLSETEPLLIFFILFQLLGAIGALGSRGLFVDDVIESGPIVIPGKSVKGALGLNEKGPTFGFTKANELFVGRLAQLGFAISIIGEVITGKGALAQLNIETGVPLQDIEPLILLNIVFFFFAAINPGTGKFINDEDVEL